MVGRELSFDSIRRGLTSRHDDAGVVDEEVEGRCERGDGARGIANGGL